MNLFGRKSADSTATAEIEALRKEVRELRDAYNAWFDLVAPELGFKGETTYKYDPYSANVYTVSESPRKAAFSLEPERKTVVRIAPKVCEKKPRG